jgi:hypothetical protein
MEDTSHYLRPRVLSEAGGVTAAGFAKDSGCSSTTNACLHFCREWGTFRALMFCAGRHQWAHARDTQEAIPYHGFPMRFISRGFCRFRREG